MNDRNGNQIFMEDCKFYFLERCPYCGNETDNCSMKRPETKCGAYFRCILDDREICSFFEHHKRWRSK